VSGRVACSGLHWTRMFEPETIAFFLSTPAVPQGNTACWPARLLNGQPDELKRSSVSRGPKSRLGALRWRIAFMPDNTLVLSLGDGFNYRLRSRRKTPAISALSFSPNSRRSAPEDNPYVGHPPPPPPPPPPLEGALPELYHIGHRNVQGLIYDTEGQRVLAHEMARVVGMRSTW